MSNPTTPGRGPVSPLNIPYQPPDINVGVVTTDDAAYEDNGEGQVWCDYLIQHRYEQDLKKYMMGVASPSGYRGKNAAFVQLAHPTLLWICDWTAMQYGGQPNIPDPFSVGTDWELLDVVLEPAMLALQPDGSTAGYRISGTYVFGHTNPGACEGYIGSVFATAQFPRAPWLQDTFSRNVPVGTLQSQLATWQGGGGNLRAAPGVPFVGRRN